MSAETLGDVTVAEEQYIRIRLFLYELCSHLPARLLTELVAKVDEQAQRPGEWFVDHLREVGALEELVRNLALDLSGHTARQLEVERRKAERKGEERG